MTQPKAGFASSPPLYGASLRRPAARTAQAAARFASWWERQDAVFRAICAGRHANGRKAWQPANEVSDSPREVARPMGAGQSVPLLQAR
jgi:hypothetical protein